MCKINMENIGLSQNFLNEASLYSGLYIGRVIYQYKNLYKVVTKNGELMAEIAGKMRFSLKTLTAYPAVGDFVLLDRQEDITGYAIIHRVLQRKTVFIRKAAGKTHEEQIVAANIDTVFICMSVNNDYNIRRLERYLSIAWESGAVPVVVLTKADLDNNIAQKLSELAAVTYGVEVLVTSSFKQKGIAPIQKYTGYGKTIAFIGSSGAGKSTLINRLIDKDFLKTNGIRNDDKGRHTTTWRELIMLPCGGAVIDTPGMRELGVSKADFTKTFADIAELAKKCKFHDCTHIHEPHCAVQRAVADGILSAARLASYLKLQKESEYEGLNSKQIENKKTTVMFAEMGGRKNARSLVKAKSKRR